MISRGGARQSGETRVGADGQSARQIAARGERRLLAGGLNRSRGSPPTGTVVYRSNEGSAMLRCEAIGLVFQRSSNHGLDDSIDFPASPAHARRHAYAQDGRVYPGREKWLRLSEQSSPIFKWTAGGLRTVQSCPRRRSALATNRPTRWATRGAPGSSSYAATFIAGRCAK